MLSRLFGRRITVSVTVLGVVAGRMVRWDGRVRIPPGADLETALQAAGRAVGVDLLGALEAGAQPAVLVNGRRVELPESLSKVVDADTTISWLMPMAGG